jgi:hypothetical protein
MPGGGVKLKRGYGPLSGSRLWFAGSGEVKGFDCPVSGVVLGCWSACKDRLEAISPGSRCRRQQNPGSTSAVGCR